MKNTKIDHADYVFQVLNMHTRILTNILREYEGNNASLEKKQKVARVKRSNNELVVSLDVFLKYCTL